MTVHVAPRGHVPNVCEGLGSATGPAGKHTVRWRDARCRGQLDGGQRVVIIMGHARLHVLLVQLPIPPAGPQPVRGNVPLAAGYLKLFARQQGLEEAFAIEILPPRLVNILGDRGLVREILDRRPWMVGFTCYVWNIERTLWVAARLKEADPEIHIVLGGPEITRDNAWVLSDPAVDYAVMGEGEQTFAELLWALRSGLSERGKRRSAGRKSPRAGRSARHELGSPLLGLSAVALPGNPKTGPRQYLEGIPGLWSKGMAGPPARRTSWTNLDALSSPYLAGVLDAAEEQTMFLETVRGCAFGCKFCYYPKSYDAVYAVSHEKIAANLRHATERGVKEIVLLDPTLNQRPDFIEFLSLLAEHNPGRQWTCFGELRAEGIDAPTARRLREAGFTEVEVGLQSLDRRAQRLMGRTVNLKAFERGAKAMLDEGLTVRVDLILGLPGDTPDSLRRSIDYLHRSKLYSEVQVFNLSVLPGTAFRHEASRLGLEFQSRPPYYAIQTPTLGLEQLYELMEEAQEAFGLEFDPWSPPILERLDATPGGPIEKGTLPDQTTHPSEGLFHQVTIDLDRVGRQLPELPAAEELAMACSLVLRSSDFEAKARHAGDSIRSILDHNPHTSLDVLLVPKEGIGCISKGVLSHLIGECFASTTYLDLYYSLHPNQLAGAKRLVFVLPVDYRSRVPLAEIDWISQYATIAWHDTKGALTREGIFVARD